MRNFFVCLIGIVAGSLWSSSAFAVSLIYEPFDYTSGLDLAGLRNTSTGTTAGTAIQTDTTVGNIWKVAANTATSVAANSIDIASGSLSAPSEANTLKSAIGNSLTILDGTNSGAADRLAFRASAVASGPPSGENITTGTIFYSFLLNVGSLTGANNTTGDYFISLNNTANAATTANPTVHPGEMRIRIDPTDGSKYDLGMFTQRSPTAADTGWSNNTTSGTPISLTTGQTYFVVASFAVGASNSTKLWINPDQTFFGGAAAAPITSQDLTSGSNGTTIGSILLHQRNLNPELGIDELRVGTTWAEVTPLGTPTLYWDINGSTAGAGGAGSPAGTWDGSNTNWNNVSDGTGNALQWSAGGVAVFSAGSDANSPYTVTVSGTQSVAGLTFKDTAATATLSGGTVTLSGLHTITANSGVTANMGTAIGGTVGMVKDGAGTLVLTGNQTYSGNTSINAGTLQLGNGGTTGTLPTSSAITTNATLTINRSNAVVQGTDFSGSAIDGAGGLTNAGSGTTTLNAANTFSGTTRLGANGGTLVLANSLALQNSTLDMNSADNGAVSFGSLSAVTLGGLTGSRNLALISSSADYNGNGTVDAADYPLWRKSPNSYGGDPAGYNAWRAQFGNSGSGALALSLGSSTSPTAPYTGVLSGSGSSVTKIGTNTQVLSGANTYNGGTNINAGTLQFGKTFAMPSTGNVTVNSGGTLAVNSNGTDEWTESTDTSIGGTIGGLVAGRGGQGTANQITWMPGSAMAIDTANASGGAITYSGVIGSFRTTSGTTDAVGFAKRGLGKLTLSGNNTFSGQLSVAGGTADTDDTTRSILVLTGNNLNAGTSMVGIPTVSIGAFSVLELGASNILPAGSLINTTGSRAKLHLDDSVTQTVRSIFGNNGIIEVGTGRLNIVDQAGDNYVYGTPSGAYISSSDGVFDPNKGTVYKSGAGTLTLEGDAGDNFHGSFIMESGTLKLSRGQALGTNGAAGRLVVKGGQLGRSDTPTSNFTYTVGFVDLDVLRYDLSDAPAQTSQFSGGTFTTLKQNDVEINITNSGTQTATSGRFAFAGVIRNHDPNPGAGDDENAIRGITKTGNGVLTLAATNTYKGSTTVQDGVLLMSATVSTLGDYTQATIGTLNLKGGVLATTVANNTLTVKNPVVVDSSAGTATIAQFSTAASASTVMEFNNDSIVGTSGSLTIANMNTNNNTATVFRPTFTGSGFSFGLPIIVSNSANVGTGVKSNELQFGNTTGTQTISGAISGGGSVRRINAGGTTVLSGSNAYTGTTTIDAGTLLLNGTNTGGGAVAFNGGGTLGGTGSTTSAVALSSAGTIAPGNAGIESLDVGSLSISGGLLSFELNAPGSPGVNSDLLNVINSDGLTISGGTVDLINAGGLAAGTYTLIDYAGTALGDPTVDLLTLGAQPGGFTYDLVDNSGNTSIDLVVTPAGSGSVAIGAVPEPNTLMLVVLTIGPALVASRRASRRQKS